MVNTTTTAATTIQDQVATMLVQPLEAASVVLSSGATIFNSSEPLRIPRLTSSGSVGWVGEGETIPDTYAASFNEIALMPTSRKSIKAIVRVTNELIRQSKIGVSGVLQQRIVHDVKTKLDDALLNGTGKAADGTTPDGTVTGVLHQAGTQPAELDLADPDSLLDALALATAAEVVPNRWIFNGGDFYTLRKVKDTTGKYILEADITADTSYRLFGVPVSVSNRMPEGKGLLMDTKQLAVVRDIDPQVKILDQAYADTDETGIRVVTRYDLGLLHPEGVVVLTADEG